MAEIEIERRPRRSGWMWLVLVIVLSAVAVGAWLVLMGDTAPGDAAPAAETTTIQEPLSEPIQPLESPEAGARPEQLGEEPLTTPATAAPAGDEPIGG